MRSFQQSISAASASWTRKYSESESSGSSVCNSETTDTSSNNINKRGIAGKNYSYNQEEMVHRLVRRNLPLHQSDNYLQVTNHQRVRYFNLLRHDWFHVVLRVNPFASILVLLSVWTAVIVVFAGFYMMIDSYNEGTDCGLGPIGSPIAFGPAFAFSLETCTTVGYGLPGGTNAFFEDNCNSVQLVIYFQMVWSMMFNAFLFAFFFARLSRGETRGVQIIFSDKAIVSPRKKSPGNLMMTEENQCPFPCFQFRVFDIDSKHPVVEAHVRVFAIHRNTSIPHPLRLIQPNDEIDTMLFTSLPSEVVHSIDGYSSLAPPFKPSADTPSTVMPGYGLVLRQCDSLARGRDDIECPVCGETFGSMEGLCKHGKFSAEQERLCDIPPEYGHQIVDWDAWLERTKIPHYDGVPALKAYFEQEISEIICVVEGIEPLTSCSFQALHSYQIKDIHFGPATFADCVTLHKKDDANLVVDLDDFHRIETIKEPAAVPIEKSEQVPCVVTPVVESVDSDLEAAVLDC